jgi:hypothetical protein
MSERNFGISCKKRIRVREEERLCIERELMLESGGAVLWRKRRRSCGGSQKR